MTNKLKKTRIFITGDTHCPIDIHKLNSKNFPIGKSLTKNDIVIICGDAGFVWFGDKRDQWWIKWIERKPWTTVYVDGNHENHELLKNYPVVEFYGAKAHKISESLYHIIRGEIMDINNKKLFCFGGAFSHDREYRTEGIDWWQSELPTYEEIKNAISNLYKYDNKIDYIITHDVPSKINNILGYNIPNMDNYDQSHYVHICHFFQYIIDIVDYKTWFAGHYHVNRKIDDIQILYNQIVELNDSSATDKTGYKVVDNNVSQILSRRFSRTELKRLCKKENLYMSNRRMDIYENFGINETIIPVETFFDIEVSDLELQAITHMYNIYSISKDTMNE